MVVRSPVQVDGQHSGQTVLVVEDEWVLRATLADYLRDCGFDVSEAASADEAVELLAGGLSVALVISDVRMPGARDGIHLAEWVAENRPGLPVVLASGAAGPGRETEAMRHAHWWLGKPYKFEELDRAINKVLQAGS